MVKRKTDKEDKAIMSVTRSVGLMTYLTLYDKFGFKEQKLRNFYSAFTQIMDDWSENIITTEELMRYCEKKHINAYGTVKGIPTSKKMGLVDKRFLTPGALTFIDSGMLAVLMIISSVLKERYKFTIKQMDDFLYWIDYWVDSYTRKQPKTNIPYLNDKMIIDTFIDEMQLDLDSGKKVA